MNFGKSSLIPSQQTVHWNLAGLSDDEGNPISEAGRRDSPPHSAIRSFQAHHRDKLVTVTTSCLKGLQPWKKRSFLTAGVRLGSIPSRREVVTTDASLARWGAVWQCRAAQGSWDTQQGEQHINVLELWAVVLALKHFLTLI